MRLTDFKKIKLKHGDPVVIIWDDIVEVGGYGYDPKKPVDKQMVKFIFMGWFIKQDGDKISVAIEPEHRDNIRKPEDHPYRTVQMLSVGDICKIARLSKPRKWWE